MLATPPAGGDEDQPAEQPFHKAVYKLFSRALKSQTPTIQFTACTALCKLMLSDPSVSAAGTSSIMNNDALLRLLVMAYFDPETAGNPALRQSLAYFLPVYCHSRKDNLERMGRVATSLLSWFISVREELDVEGEEDVAGDMVGLGVIIAHLVDWTDSRKLAAALSGLGTAGSNEDDGEVHLDWALEMLEKVLGVTSSKSSFIKLSVFVMLTNIAEEERKAYISVLSKLNYNPEGSAEKLQEVLRLVTEGVDDKVAADTASRNALNKVQAALIKATTSQQQPGQDRSGSRAVSIAPFAVDEGEVTRIDDRQSEADITEAEAEVNNTAILAPTPSPRKRAARAPQAKNIRKPIIEESEEEVDVSTAGEGHTLTLVDRSRVQSGAGNVNVEETDEDEDDATPQPVKSTPAPRAVPLKPIGKSSLNSGPDKSARQTKGRSAKSAARVVEDSLVDSLLECTEIKEEVVQEPVKKPRGRPPRTDSAELAATRLPEPAATGRKSVRAGRRKATEA